MRLVPAAIVFCFAALTGRAAIAGPPAPSAPIVEAARAREMANDAAGAVADVRAYLAVHPDDAAAGRILGDLYFRSGNVRAAEDAWKNVLADHPDDALAHARLGSLYGAQNRFAEAIREYDADMPSVGAAGALVRLHARTGDLGAFVGDIEALEDRYRFNPDFLTIEAAVFAAVHRGADALGLYTRVITLRHGRCSDLVARANEYLALQRTSDAIADLERCLATDSAAYDALAALGAAYLARNNRAAARQWTDRALAVNPGGIQALIDRGVLEGADEDWAASMRDEEAAIAADPLRSEGYANLAADLLQQRAITVAEATIDDGLRAAPSDARLHFLLGQTYQLEGRPAAAARAQYLAALSSDEDVIVRAARDRLRSLGVQ